MKKKSLLSRTIKYRLWNNFANPRALRGLAAAAVGMNYRPVFPARGVDRGEVVVLVHGLLHSSAVMYRFATALAKDGYTVEVYDYRTTRADYPEHATAYREYLREIFRKYPDAPVNIVTHSMGGIITRIALADEDDPLDMTRIKCVVMLAPPNRGSACASEVVARIPRLSRMLCKPLRNLCDDPGSLIHTLPWLCNVRIGVIAGVYDRRVALHSTPCPGQVDYLELPCGHSFMMFNTEIHKQTLNFLEQGFFMHR